MVNTLTGPNDLFPKPPIKEFGPVNKPNKVYSRDEAVNFIEKEYQPTFVKVPKELSDTTDVTISKPFSEKLLPALENVNKKFKGKGYEIKIHQGARSLAEQQEHLKSGASTIPVSLHNVGEAVDISFWKNGKKIYIDSPTKQSAETKTMLEEIGVELENLGFIWGGRWSNPYDPWHVQQHKGTVEYLESNPELIPQFKSFIPDYQARLKSTKDTAEITKLKKIIKFLEQS